MSLEGMSPERDDEATEPKAPDFDEIFMDLQDNGNVCRADGNRLIEYGKWAAFTIEKFHEVIADYVENHRNYFTAFDRAREGLSDLQNDICSDHCDLDPEDNQEMAHCAWCDQINRIRGLLRQDFMGPNAQPIPVVRPEFRAVLENIAILMNKAKDQAEADSMVRAFIDTVASNASPAKASVAGTQPLTEKN
jgi:hypothetical protein